MTNPLASNLDPQTTNRPLNRASLVVFIVGGVIVGIALICVAAWWVGGPVFPANTLKGLRGATQDDVRRILGEPEEIQKYGVWIYSRPMNPGWVEISFDDDGRVSSVNDEQAFPVEFGSGSW